MKLSGALRCEDGTLTPTLSRTRERGNCSLSPTLSCTWATETYSLSPGYRGRGSG